MTLFSLSLQSQRFQLLCKGGVGDEKLFFQIIHFLGVPTILGLLTFEVLFQAVKRSCLFSPGMNVACLHLINNTLDHLQIGKESVLAIGIVTESCGILLLPFPCAAFKILEGGIFCIYGLIPSQRVDAALGCLTFGTARRIHFNLKRNR